MQVRRRQPDLEIVVLEKGTVDQLLGLRHPVPGRRRGRRRSTTWWPARPQTFRDRAPHRRAARATRPRAIDLDARTVEVRDHEHGRTVELGFDHAPRSRTGARPAAARPAGHRPADSSTACRPSTTPPPARAGRTGGGVETVVVVGGGYIGLEMAEAFVAAGRRGHRGRAVDHADARRSTPTWARRWPSALGGHRDRRAPRRRGLEAFEDGAVHDRRRAPARRPRGPRARRAAQRRAGGGGRARDRGATAPSGSTGASAPAPRACGPRATAASRSTSWPGRPVHIALGTVANKQGRVAGINIGGGYAALPRRGGHGRHQGVRHRDRPAPG